jgi:hypothetical protein
LKASYEYFLHINHPDRYQGYDKDEIQTYNNFHIEPTKYEMNIIAQEMIKIIKDKDIVEWCECVEYFNDTPEMSMILATRTAYFSAYVKSRYYKRYPDRVRMTEVKVVKEFSCEKGKV